VQPPDPVVFFALGRFQSPELPLRERTAQVFRGKESLFFKTDFSHR